MRGFTVPKTQFYALNMCLVIAMKVPSKAMDTSKIYCIKIFEVK